MSTRLLDGGPIKFMTSSGSVYEVDFAAHRVRRLSGKNDPTPRQGKDGEWREYKEMTPIRIGDTVLIKWKPEETPLLPETQAMVDAGEIPADLPEPFTWTSPVREVLL